MDKDELNKLQRDKSIDQEALDVEVVAQPEIFLYWSEKAVEIRAERDRQKTKLERTEARLDGECRDNPEEFGLTKVTEKAVNAAVTCHQDFIDQEDLVIELERKTRLYDQIVSTMEQKKRMLELLVTLHGQQYFAGPSVPRDIGEEWSKHQKQVEEEVNEKQRDMARKPKTKRRGNKEE